MNLQEGGVDRSAVLSAVLQGLKLDPKIINQEDLRPVDNVKGAEESSLYPKILQFLRTRLRTVKLGLTEVELSIGTYSQTMIDKKRTVDGQEVVERKVAPRYNFNPGVSESERKEIESIIPKMRKQQFANLRRIFKDKPDLKNVIEREKVKFPQREEYVQEYYNVNGKTHRVRDGKGIVKERYATEELYDNGIRLSLSTESPSYHVVKKIEENKIATRKIKRDVYDMGLFQIHISEVEEDIVGKSVSHRIEVEFEFIIPKGSISDSYVENIARCIVDITNTFRQENFSISDSRIVMSRFNTYLGEINEGFFSNSFYTRIVDIRATQLLEQDFGVSPKVNGEHRFIFGCQEGIFAINPPVFWKKLSDFSVKEQFVLEGEVQEKAGKEIYTIFDIYHKSDPYMTRYSALQGYVDFLNQLGIITLKKNVLFPGQVPMNKGSFPFRDVLVKDGIIEIYKKFKEKSDPSDIILSTEYGGSASISGFYEASEKPQIHITSFTILGRFVDVVNGKKVKSESKIRQKRMEFMKYFSTKEATVNYINTESGVDLYARLAILVKVLFPQWPNRNDMNLDYDGIIFHNLGDYKSQSFKWKPIELLTIDFRIKNKVAYIYDDKERREVPFRGSSRFRIERDLHFNVEDGIYECGMVDPTEKERKLQSDYDMKVYRKRLDKSRPNNILTATNVWNLICDPFRVQSLVGDDAYIMRKFNNYAKDILISDVIASASRQGQLIQDQEGKDIGVSQTSSPIVIMDVGSGRGGDVSKYLSEIPNISFIYFVEPNQNNVEELRNRLRKCRFPEDKYEIIDKKFQDVKKRDISHPIDLFMCFYALTFSAESEEVLRTYMKNISDFGSEKAVMFAIYHDSSKVKSFISSQSMGTNIITGRLSTQIPPGNIQDYSLTIATPAFSLYHKNPIVEFKESCGEKDKIVIHDARDTIITQDYEEYMITKQMIQREASKMKLKVFDHKGRIKDTVFADFEKRLPIGAFINRSFDNMIYISK